MFVILLSACSNGRGGYCDCNINQYFSDTFAVLGRLYSINNSRSCCFTTTVRSWTLDRGLSTFISLFRLHFMHSLRTEMEIDFPSSFRRFSDLVLSLQSFSAEAKFMKHREAARRSHKLLDSERVRGKEIHRTEHDCHLFRDWRHVGGEWLYQLRR